MPSYTENGASFGATVGLSYYMLKHFNDAMKNKLKDNPTVFALTIFGAVVYTVGGAVIGATAGSIYDFADSFFSKKVSSGMGPASGQSNKIGI